MARIDREERAPEASPSPPASAHIETEISPPGANALSEGALVAGRYRIEKGLGRGGMGAVFLARDEQVAGRPVAVKVLLEGSANSEWLRAKFDDERRALARLQHPGIVAVTDAGGFASGQPFLVMEYVPGPTLRTLLLAGPLPIADAAMILGQLGRAVATAHAHGIVHRDLKPENIIVQDLGNGERLVKVIDFGVATVHDSLTPAAHLTRAAGTRAYMAPEQLRGRPTLASDVYALAAIAYEMLTGRLPFAATNDVGLLEEQKQGLKCPPSAVRTETPRACDEPICRGLSFEASRRPASARELGEALVAALSIPVSGSAPTARATSRAPALVRRAVVGGSIVAALATGGVTARRWLERDARPAVSVAPQAYARVLTYSLSVQRFRNGRPYRAPFTLPGEMLFAVDDRIRLVCSSPQDGFLYLLNEGPASQGQLPSYNVLFPSTSTRAGTATVAAGEEIQIPDKTWLVFDEEQGRERLWLIWSAHEEPVLARVAALANPIDRGEVRAEGDRRTVRDYLAGHREAPLAVEYDAARGQTLLRSRAETLVATIALEHR